MNTKMIKNNCVTFTIEVLSALKSLGLYVTASLACRQNWLMNY